MTENACLMKFSLKYEKLFRRNNNDEWNNNRKLYMNNERNENEWPKIGIWLNYKFKYKKTLTYSAC